MHGIATIDRQPGSDTIAVWITNRTEPSRAQSVNAVVIDEVNDPRGLEKVRLLTRCCVVLATDGSSLEGLPIKGDHLTVADLKALVAETEGHQQRIVAEIDAYKQRTKSKTLVSPTFLASPKIDDFPPTADTPSQRALATANFVASVWMSWLTTDEERRRRTVQPKTQLSPWIMPEELNDPTVPDFPPGFGGRLHEQPLV
ncbi:hypothetical protein E0F15_21255 [Frankia sp. B2]|uniref:hypothetical protein n=1 Tax=Frankia sp. B2 TaxID=2541730 RepID=UPI00106C7CEA|nr:hypothetical protein [Frankia sp. B2]TFE24619.1 hypothetical protein E0F15_21255 [Frankia sp. B2]